MNIALKIAHWRCRIWNGTIRAFELGGTRLKVVDLHHIPWLLLFEEKNGNSLAFF